MRLRLSPLQHQQLEQRRQAVNLPIAKTGMGHAFFSSSRVSWQGVHDLSKNKDGNRFEHNTVNDIAALRPSSRQIARIPECGMPASPGNAWKDESVGSLD